MKVGKIDSGEVRDLSFFEFFASDLLLISFRFVELRLENIANLHNRFTYLLARYSGFDDV